MATLKADWPLSRCIARSVLHFLSSVEPTGGVDAEALDVAKDCLSEVFKIDQSLLDDHSNPNSLVKIFTSRNGTENGAENVVFSDQQTDPVGNSAEQVLPTPQPLDVGMGRETRSPGRDELFGCFFDALEKIHYFRRLPDGNDEQAQLDIATNYFHNAVKEIEVSGSTLDQKTLAETFKSKGNSAMQSKVHQEAIDLYTYAIALCDNNAVYYCNRAAAYTQVQRYNKAVQDCLKSIELNPNYSKAYSRLGFAYYAQGNYRDAIGKGFLRALQLDPDNESVKENIRVAEQKLKEQQRPGSGQEPLTISPGSALCKQKSYLTCECSSEWILTLYIMPTIEKLSSASSRYQNGGGSRNNSAAPHSFTTIPISLNDLTTEMRFMRTPGSAFPGQQQSQSRHDGAREAASQGNINADELPEEISFVTTASYEIYSQGDGSLGHRRTG